MSFLRNNLKFVPRLQLFRKFSSEKPWQEVSIPVPWGQIRGKWWGSTDLRPILTLHGWQDNCGTWDRLIPLLNKNIGFLAIDLPGHGLSSKLPAGIYYHYTTYLIVVKAIIKYFAWPKVSLMGHSMGGITCYTYTMLYPENVDFVACVDGAKPKIRNNHIAYLRHSLSNFMENNDFAMSPSEPPSYTLDEIKKKIHQPNNGSVDLDHTHCIIERNIAPSRNHPGTFYFTRDPRLKSDELLNISQADLVENAKNITCPIFIAKATNASFYEKKEYFYDVLSVLKQSSIDCDFYYIGGTHHTHLNTPDELAGFLTKFIHRHTKDDRSTGGFKKECMVTS